MHDHSTNTNGVRSLYHPQTCITHQRPAQPPTLQGLVHCKTAKNDYGDRIRHVATEAPWRCINDDRTRSQRIVRSYTRPFAKDKSTRRTGCLIFQGTVL